MFNFQDILLLFSILQLLLVGVLLLCLKSGNNIANKFLALFLISKAICFFSSLTWNFIESKIYIQFFILTAYSFDLLLGPFLYFYIKKSTFNEVKFDKYFYAHFIPFTIGLIAASVFCLPHFGIYKNNVFIIMVFGIFPFPRFIEFSIYLHFVIYSSLSISLLSNYSKYLTINFSYANVKMLKWLRTLLGGFIFIWVMNMLDIVLRLKGLHGIFLFTITIIGIFVFANSIVIIAIRYPEMFRDKIPAVKRKYEKTLLDESEKEIYTEKLNRIMNDEKIYLSCSLGLADLAEKLNVQNHIMSQIINTVFGKNFYDYVNFFRVEECKKLLTSAPYKSKSVLEIAFECGFNSKSVFNDSFKKNTGFTPSEFRRKFQSN